MSETRPIILQSARENELLFLTQSELRQRGVMWLWLALGGCFALWFGLDWFLPGAAYTSGLHQSLLWGRLLVAGLLWSGAVVVWRFRSDDVIAVLVEWVGWLCVSLYLGVAGSWLYGGGSALVATMLALLVVARGIVLPGGLRGYWPPVALLWGIYIFSLVVFSSHHSDASWVLGGLLFTQVLFALACLLGGFAAWLLSLFRAHTVQTDRLGRYQINDQLKTRGMSQLYRARHLLLQQPCIVKRIPCYAANWDEAVEEFRREAKLVMGIQTPHVVRVFDFGETQIDLYLAMEYLDGINLGALLRLEGPLPQRRAIHLMRQICTGMAEVHRQGILHQDLKPANLFLLAERDEFDYVKVIDFGIARRLDATAQQQEARGRGKIPGTPAYMAPERFEGKGEIASDIYAMGAVLYCLLAGRPPYRANTVAEYQTLHQQEEPPISHLHNGCRDLLPQVEAVILRSLAKHPAARFASAEAMKEALDACQEALGPWHQEDAQLAWEKLQTRLGREVSPSLRKANEHEGSSPWIGPGHEQDALHDGQDDDALDEAIPRESPALILPAPDAPELEMSLTEHQVPTATQASPDTAKPVVPGAAAAKNAANPDITSSDNNQPTNDEHKSDV